MECIHRPHAGVEFQHFDFEEESYLQFAWSGWDDTGKNVIVGLRRGGEIVPARATAPLESSSVSMSEVTADQFYLVLRLAGFEHYVQTRRPTPLRPEAALKTFPG